MQHQVLISAKPSTVSQLDLIHDLQGTRIFLPCSFSPLLSASLRFVETAGCYCFGLFFFFPFYYCLILLLLSSLFELLVFYYFLLLSFLLRKRVILFRQDSLFQSSEQLLFSSEAGLLQWFRVSDDY